MKIVLIQCLIVCFTLLIVCQIIYGEKYIENFSNKSENNKKIKKQIKSYKIDDNNVMILAQQNAGNINVLNDKFASIDTSQILKNSDKLSDIQKQLDIMAEAQQNYLETSVGTEPANITGI